MPMKNLLRTIRNDLLLVLAGTFLGLAVLLLVHLLPLKPMQDHVYWSLPMIEKEFEDEVIVEGYRSTLTGNFTDCLMLEHAVYQAEGHSLLEQVLHMYRAESYESEGGWWPGHSLKDYLENTPQPREVQYARYWHGYLVILKPLLLLTSFNTIRLLNSALQLLLAGCVVMGFCRRDAMPLAMGFLLSLPFLFFVSTYASLSLSICFYVMTISLLAQLGLDPLLVRKGMYGQFFLVVGMATSYTGIPSVCIPVSPRSGNGRRHPQNGGTQRPLVRGIFRAVGHEMGAYGPAHGQFHDPGRSGHPYHQDLQCRRIFQNLRILQRALEEYPALRQLVLCDPGRPCAGHAAVAAGKERLPAEKP